MIKHFRFIILVGFVFLLNTAQTPIEKELLPTSLPVSKAKHLVRVAVQINVPSIDVMVQGPHEIQSVSEPGLFMKGGGDFQGTIYADQDGFRINGVTIKVRLFELKSLEGGTVKVNKRTYGETVRVMRSPEGGLTVISELNIEEYLRGVLPVEVSPRWPMEALRAQAVVSRTFATFKAIEKSDQPYDLVSTVYSQVYVGEDVYDEETDRAIRLTMGELLVYEENIFPAYFHATCGGRTAKADEIWDVQPNDVFQSRPCEFCKLSPHYEWTLNILRQDVERIMQQNGYPAFGLKAIHFEDRDQSNRARKVRIVYSNSEVVISADDFRKFIGYDRLRSLNAEATLKDAFMKFKGFGWGHGIGLCQWGAKGQAEAGKKYREILQFYYPNSQIMRS